MNEKSCITILNKEELTITGINKINSLDTTHFDIETTVGNLKVTGLSLEMNQLDSVNKTLLIKGDIESVSYKNLNNVKEGIIKKIFK